MNVRAGKLLAAAALAGVTACAGGGGQGGSSLLPGGLNAQTAFGPVPSGTTVVRVRMPGSSTFPTASAMPTIGTVVQPPLASSPPPVAPGPGVSTAPTLAAQSMAISFSGPTTLSQTVSFGSPTSNCIAATNATTCQAAFALAPGTYTATVTLYSSSLPSAAAALNAQQTIAFAVSYAGSNVVNLAYGGTPAQAQLVPAASNAAANA
ncbi:MAG: hypothetical protein ABIZ82_01180, partial [Candidatus Tumulicola sp.]